MSKRNKLGFGVKIKDIQTNSAKIHSDVAKKHNAINHTKQQNDKNLQSLEDNLLLGFIPNDLLTTFHVTLPNTVQSIIKNTYSFFFKD